jgi:hypothetical protein
MTPPSNQGWSELHLSENPAVELLQALGYTYVATKETILTERPARAFNNPNPWLPGENLKKAIRTVTIIQASSLLDAAEKVHMPLPMHALAVREQTELADVLAAIDTRLGREQDVLVALRTLKSALMSVLLTGEVRVQPDSVAPSNSARSPSVEASS